jgi:excisionase family DNA binding protein
MTVSDMFHMEKENRSPAEELHHISEQLDELIRLIRNGTLSTERTDVKPSPTDKEVMTVKEAAAMLRISLPKMYELAKSGKIHTLTVGRRILVSRSSLMALLLEGE